jgi:hypothetical protein
MKGVNSDIPFDLLTMYWHTEKCLLSEEKAGLERKLYFLSLLDVKGRQILLSRVHGDRLARFWRGQWSVW